MTQNREVFRAHFREAIQLIEELIRDDETTAEVKSDCERIIDHILDGWDALEIHFDQIENEQRKLGGKFGFLPGGQVYLDDDELEPGDGE